MKPSIFPDRFDLDELTQIIQMCIQITAFAIKQHNTISPAQNWWGDTVQRPLQ